MRAKQVLPTRHGGRSQVNLKLIYMKKYLLFALILVAPMLFSSCENDLNTDMETIEAQLREFVNLNEVTRCTVVVMQREETFVEHQNVAFELYTGFLVITASGTEYRYNLLYLSKYSLDTSNKLILYFSNSHY